jgi:hypothetical protein
VDHSLKKNFKETKDKKCYTYWTRSLFNFLLTTQLIHTKENKLQDTSITGEARAYITAKPQQEATTKQRQHTTDNR